jgi:hypothetical protein
MSDQKSQQSITIRPKVVETAFNDIETEPT